MASIDHRACMRVLAGSGPGTVTFKALVQSAECPFAEDSVLVPLLETLYRTPDMISRQPHLLSKVFEVLLHLWEASPGMYDSGGDQTIWRGVARALIIAGC